MRLCALPAFRNREENAYNWLLYTHIEQQGVGVEEFSVGRILRRRYSIVHVHWPDAFLNIPSYVRALPRLVGLLILLSWARLRGARVVWTAHNLRAHEGRFPATERLYWKLFTRLVDGYICLSESGREAVRERHARLRGLPSAVVPLGHYRDEFPNDSSQDARARLGIPPEASVILSLGWIRPYKNVPGLIRAFRQVTDPRALLYIVGQLYTPDLETEIRREAEQDARVRLRLELVPKEEVQQYFRAADLAVLPYRDIFNSSAVMLALSYNRPVLAPELGAFRELVERVGPQWVRTYQGDFQADHLRAALAWARDTHRPAQADLAEFDWERLARRTVEAYRDVLGMPPQAAPVSPSSARIVKEVR